MPALKPVAVQPDLVNQVYVSLRDAICEGHLKPGERLNQDQLAGRLHVSRQPVVQAIQLLKSQGFVRDTGRRGVEIAPLSASEALHLYQIRAALDGLAAREAARLNPGLARNEGQTLIEQGRLCCQKGNVLELARADMAFHQLIYRLSENPLIDATIAPHWHHLLRIMVVVLKNVPPVLAVWDEHAAILQAICQGDDVTAERLARSHGEQAAQRIVPRLS